MKYDSSVVSWVLPTKVVAYCQSEDDRHALRRLGARRSLLRRSEWSIPYEAMEDLPEIFRTLRDEGFAFLGGSHGWPPAAIFMELRDRGDLDGEYQEVLVYGPGLEQYTSR